MKKNNMMLVVTNPAAASVCPREEEEYWTMMATRGFQHGSREEIEERRKIECFVVYSPLAWKGFILN